MFYKGLSFGSKDYTKELETVECTSFLGQTSRLVNLHGIRYCPILYTFYSVFFSLFYSFVYLLLMFLIVYFCNMSRPVTVLTFDSIAVLNIFMSLLKEAFTLKHTCIANARKSQTSCKNSYRV